MDVITIDFETYFDKTYSLAHKSQTTESYVRDERFEVLGMGYSINGEDPVWLQGEPAVRSFLARHDLRNYAILAHNTKFDGAILDWKYGVCPRIWLDTMLMARPFHAPIRSTSLASLSQYYGLGEKGDGLNSAVGKHAADFTQEEYDALGKYCLQDVSLTYQLFQRLSGELPAEELAIIDMTLRMFIECELLLDIPLLENTLELMKNNIADELDRIAGVLNVNGGELKVLLRSSNKFANILRGIGVEPPQKISPTTGKPIFAFSKTDEGFQDLMASDNDLVSSLCKARLMVKSVIEQTRMEEYIAIAKRGAFPISLMYYGTHTGRYSGTEKTNTQNLPRHEDSVLRNAICAPDGYMIVTADSSQVEPRLLSCTAGQMDLLSAFREGRDAYCEFATTVYGREITKADKEERFLGKQAVLGLGYNLGYRSFRERIGNGSTGMKLDIEENMAKLIVQKYRSQYTAITGLWDRCQHALGLMMSGGYGELAENISFDQEGIRLPNGLYLLYPELRTEMVDGRLNYAYSSLEKKEGKATQNKVTKYLYGGKVVENLIQALARVVIWEHMVKLSPYYKIVMQVHDEIVMLVPAGQVESAKAHITEVMRTPPKWMPGVPLDCEVGVGATYGKAK